jgi:predicted transcriptional regulator
MKAITRVPPATLFGRGWNKGENSMEQLRELEKRVLDVIQQNKELQENSIKLKEDNIKLVEQCKQYEASIMKQGQNTKVLETEKASVKTTVEELLRTIKSLEKTN